MDIAKLRRANLISKQIEEIKFNLEILKHAAGESVSITIKDEFTSKTGKGIQSLILYNEIKPIFIHYLETTLNALEKSFVSL